VLALAVFLALFVLAGLAVLRHADRSPYRTAGGGSVSVGVRWPGPPDSCVTDPSLPSTPNCYREAVDLASFVKQPASTWSALALSLAGLLILAGRSRGRSTFSDLSRIRLGWVAVAMGPGAMLFHGTLTRWGGWFDQLSMWALLSFIAGHDSDRAGRGSFRSTFWTMLAVAGVISATSGGAAFVVFVATATLLGVLQLRMLRTILPRRGFEREGSRLLAAFAALGLALVPWALSDPTVGGAPTPIPFHAMWHVLSAVFVWCYFVYLRSERPRAARQTLAVPGPLRSQPPAVTATVQPLDDIPTGKGEQR